MTSNDLMKLLERSLASLTPPADKPKAKLDVLDVQYHGEKLTVPVGMTLNDAIEHLQRRRDYENTKAKFTEEIEVSPIDGAHALLKVLEATFGFAEGKVVQTMFGERPPTLMTVRTSVHTSTQVPWGTFNLPAPLNGTISTGWTKTRDVVVFQLVAETIRANEPAIRGLFEKVREYLREHSLYQGKAFTVTFRDNDGDPLQMPEPEFMDTNVDDSMLAFNDDVAAAIRTNLFTPITRLNDLLANGIPVKRGVLLAGTYGTGKTLTAAVAAKLATAAGITFVHVRRADEIADAITFARPYSEPAVIVFCEDIDAVTSGKRDADLNDVLNTIDGVHTKTMRLITLLTTNHVETITQAMLRPGRLDAIIEIAPPNADTVERLLRSCGRGVIPPNADLSDVAAELDGAIPALIAEVVKRAKLAQLARQAPGTQIVELSAEALMESAKTMRAQRTLLARRIAEGVAPLPV